MERTIREKVRIRPSEGRAYRDGQHSGDLDRGVDRDDGRQEGRAQH